MGNGHEFSFPKGSTRTRKTRITSEKGEGGEYSRPSFNLIDFETPDYMTIEKGLYYIFLCINFIGLLRPLLSKTRF